MTKFLSRYPDGAAGVALVLMRLSCAIIAYSMLARLPLPIFFSDFATILSAVIAFALVTGIGTRAIAFMLAGVAMVDVFKNFGDGGLAMIGNAIGYAALVLLGPGAYSIDANVFGRRVVRLNPHSPDRGSGD